MRAQADQGSGADLAAWAGMACAAAMIAHQVGAKSARDALFLSSFGASALPTMVMISAAVSIGFVLIAGRVMAALGPLRMAPMAFGASGALLVGEWELARVEPGAAAVVVYLHVATFGSVLISVFWSLVGERFDPRAAKQRIARIASAGTLGGVLGGVAAERVAATIDVRSILVLLATLHFACAWSVRLLRPDPAGSRARPIEAASPRASAFSLLRGDSYLRSIALLVGLGSAGVALMDYLFKTAAVEAYGTGAPLLRFFAAFYTVTGLLTFAGQIGLSRLALEHLGLANTAAALPVTAAAGGLLNLVAPGLGSATGLRGAEAVMRGCLHRPAYELLYTPLPPGEKRVTKTLVDVALDRVGDIGGGVVARLVLAAAPRSASTILSGLVVAGGLAGFWMARRLHPGYVHALERSLLSRAVDIDPAQVLDSTTRAIVLETRAAGPWEGGSGTSVHVPILGSADTLDNGLFMLGTTSRAAPATPAVPAEAPKTHAAPALDPAVLRIADLRSGDPGRVRAALRGGALDRREAPHAIALLAWDEVWAEAASALRAQAPRITGLLLDSLLDPDEEFAIRRRVPRILGHVPGQRAADGLLRGLEDRRFEVRFECARALLDVRHASPDVKLGDGAVHEVVLREAAVSPEIWESRQLLDGWEAGGEMSLADDWMRARCNRSLEHVFNLLSLVLPREPIRVAFRGLHTDDEDLRGTAREYLDNILPARIREALRPFLEPEPASASTPRSREEILAALLQSQPSIELHLEELRRVSESNR